MSRDEYRDKAAAPFYKSKAWQRCRRDYAASQAGLCEQCREMGLIVPGEIVHHIVHLDGENIHNPEVTLAWSNLRLLCRKHHAEIHAGQRWTVDGTGRIIPTPPR